MHAAGEREIADSIDVDGPVIDGEVTRIADPLSTHARAARPVAPTDREREVWGWLCDCAGDLSDI
jgi:hypothetical protein